MRAAPRRRVSFAAVGSAVRKIRKVNRCFLNGLGREKERERQEKAREKERVDDERTRKDSPRTAVNDRRDLAAATG